MTLENLMLVRPEIWVASMACFILILDLFIKQSKRWVTYYLSLLTLIGAAYFTLITPQFEHGIYLFNGGYYLDHVGLVLKMFLYLVTAIVFVYSRCYLIERQLYLGEFFVLTLFSMLGMMVVISSGHFLSLYLGVELLALPLYAILAMHKSQTSSSEAAIKYFIMGGLASGLLLYGISLVYGATGSIQFSDIGTAALAVESSAIALQIGMMFVLAGLAFKLGVAPFHMWVPDVYHGAPTAVTLLIGSMPKIAAFAMAYRLLAQAFGSMDAEWQSLLIVMSVLSLSIGNLIAIVQSNIKRMLAYSTIGHMGFVLLGLLCANNEGYLASMYYMIIYVLMSLGAFGMIIVLSHKGFEAEEITDFKGLSDQNPWLALLMLLVLFSMAGVPPTAGFYAKFLVLKAAIDSGFVWLAVIAMIFSVIGAYYYLRVVRMMFFEKLEPNESHTCNGMSSGGKTVLSINGIVILLLGILPAPVFYLCANAIGMF